MAAVKGCGVGGSGYGARDPVRAAVVALAVAALALGLRAQSRPTRIQAEAAYLYQFGNFVRWPHLGPGPFTICVLGADPFGAVLAETLAGQKLRGRPVWSRRIAQASQARGCQIVFVGSVKAKTLASALGQLDAAEVLTVSDLPNFAQRGGAIGFVLRGRHVRFIINRLAARLAGLKLSSELLKVAVLVLPAGRAGGTP